MSFSINRNKSQLNSFNTTIADGNTANGTYERVANHSLAEVTITTNEEVIIRSYQSRDGITSATSTEDVIAADTTTTIRLELKYKFFKLDIENGSGLTATVTIDTYLTDEIPMRKPLSNTTVNENDATLTKSILIGKTGSEFVNLKVNADGSLPIKAAEEDGSYPDPNVLPTGNDVKINVDAYGNLRTRGEVLTDELSIRDDFSGNALGGNWTEELVNGTITVGSSILELTSSTATEENRVTQDIDYCPVTLRGRLKLGGRYANQAFRFGLIYRNAGVITSGAWLEFDGTSNTVLKTKTCASADSSDFESNTVSIPLALTSSVYGHYKIDISNNAVAFSISADGISYELLQQHTLHIPDPYQALALEIGFENTNTTTNNTAYVDMVFVNNMNRVQIDQDYNFEPISARLTDVSKIAFATTTPLTSGATFDSGILKLLPNFTQVQTSVLASHDGTINIYWSTDSAGTDVVRTLSLPYLATDGFQSFAAPAGFATYVKYTFTNGGTNQTDFYYATIFLTGSQSPQIMNMESVITGKMTSMVTKSVLVGKTEGGNYYQNISSDNGGHLEVSLQNPRSAFGEISTIEPFPVAQVDFVYGINTYLTNKIETGSGAVTGSGGLLLCSTTAATSSSAQLSSLRYLKYRPGQGAKGMYTALFTTGASGSKQYAGLFTPSLNNGFGFGYDGTTFGIWYMKNGTPTHIPQTTWNNDLMNGAGGVNNKSGMNLVPTNGNVYHITYQYLGFGSIKFYIENSINGQFALVHEIKYTNSNTTPSISQPSLSLLWKAENTSNATNIVVKGASGALFVEGDRRLLGPSHGLDNNKTGITTITNVITLRNATTYNGVTNRAHIRLRTVSFASNTGGTGSGITTLKIIRNATLGGTTTFTTINGTSVDDGVTITSGNSITSYNTLGTTVTGGIVMFNSIIGVGNNADKELSELDLFAYPGDTITFSITSTQSVTAGVGITWTEDI